jgi:hypothetical protein
MPKTGAKFSYELSIPVLKTRKLSLVADGEAQRPPALQTQPTPGSAASFSYLSGF